MLEPDREGPHHDLDQRDDLDQDHDLDQGGDDRTGAPKVSGAAVRPRPLRQRPRGRARAEYLWARTRRVMVSRGDILAVIAAGGAIGSLARWGLSQALPHPATAFPWATFDANVSGCFGLGVLMVFVTEVWPPSRYVRPFLGVGVLGGYTTFSTYMLDTRALLLSRHAGLAGAYVVASLVGGMLAVWAGIAGVRLLVVARRRTQRRRRAERRRWRTEQPARSSDAETSPSTTMRSPR